MTPWQGRMLICIGHKNFIESGCVEEILSPHGPRATRLKRLAEEAGMLISATEGRRVKSMIRLKTEHLVLSSLGPETLQSKLRALNSFPASADDYEVPERPGESNPGEGAEAVSTRGPMSRPPSPACGDDLDRRTGIERRRFLYTCHVPERRRGADRRKDQGRSGRASGRRG
jgi:extracellular matrix regulatory protein A